MGRQSLRTRLARLGFNCFPAYRGTGARITFIAADWSEVRIRLPLSWRTRNYVGTIFGGSMYAAVDPIYMIMLIKRLGPGYTVWDKAASIRFLRPGRSALTASFELDVVELERVRECVRAEGRIECSYSVDLLDVAGESCARCEKVIHVRRTATVTNAAHVR